MSSGSDPARNSATDIRSDTRERTSADFQASRSRVDERTRFDLHLHQEDQLAWMSSGSMELALLGDRWHVRREHIVWIPAGVLHEMSFDEPGELICVYADPELRPIGGRWNGPRSVRTGRLARCSRTVNSDDRSRPTAASPKPA